MKNTSNNQKNKAGKTKTTLSMKKTPSEPTIDIGTNKINVKLKNTSNSQEADNEKTIIKKAWIKPFRIVKAYGRWTGLYGNQIILEKWYGNPIRVNIEILKNIVNCIVIASMAINSKKEIE